MKKATVGFVQLSHITMNTLQTAYAQALKLNQSLSELSDLRADVAPAVILSDDLVRDLGRAWASEDQTELRP